MCKACQWHGRHHGSRALLSGRRSVLIAATAIGVTGCVADQATPVSPDLTTVEGTKTITADQMTTAGAAISWFMLRSRNGSNVQLDWDWPLGGAPTHHYVLSLGSRTVVLNQYYPGTSQDVGHLDLTSGHSYTFTVRAIDDSGNASTPARLLFETTPPQPATNLRQVSTIRFPGRPEVYPDTIAYTPARDNTGTIRHHDVVVDGVVFGSIGGNRGRFSLFYVIQQMLYPVMPCGRTTIQLRAYDPSWNRSRLSVPLTVRFPDYAHCPPPHR
jgi:hypothetical protein